LRAAVESHLNIFLLRTEEAKEIKAFVVCLITNNERATKG